MSTTTVCRRKVVNLGDNLLYVRVVPLIEMYCIDDFSGIVPCVDGPTGSRSNLRAREAGKASPSQNLLIGVRPLRRLAMLVSGGLREPGLVKQPRLEPETPFFKTFHGVG